MTSASTNVLNEIENRTLASKNHLETVLTRLKSRRQLDPKDIEHKADEAFVVTSKIYESLRLTRCYLCDGLNTLYVMKSPLLKLDGEDALVDFCKGKYHLVFLSASNFINSISSEKMFYFTERFKTTSPKECLGEMTTPNGASLGDYRVLTWADTVLPPPTEKRFLSPRTVIKAGLYPKYKALRTHLPIVEEPTVQDRLRFDLMMEKHKENPTNTTDKPKGLIAHTANLHDVIDLLKRVRVYILPNFKSVYVDTSTNITIEDTIKIRRLFEWKGVEVHFDNYHTKGLANNFQNLYKHTYIEVLNEDTFLVSVEF